jgi:hypothetical protein
VTLKFIMASNLTFVANFKDITKPTLTVTAPTANEKWSNAVFTVTGTAKDNVAVSNVLVSLNGAGWTNATTLNSWSNWTAGVTLTPGTNTIAAYALDAAGNHSITNIVKFDYILSATLTVLTNGDGTISPNYNGKLLQIGASYSLMAKAATGFGFVNWTDGDGDVLTNGLTLKFIMASNLTFVANFKDITKPTLAITAPTLNEKWSNAVFTVTGTAKDNVAVSNVLVSLNGAGWTNATTLNSWSNWTAGVTLTPGTNTIAAYALDAAGNVSITNTVKLVYVPDTTTVFGSWNLIQFMTPAQITYDINNGLQGGGSFAVTNGSITLNTNGTLSGILGDAFTGSYASNSNGVIIAIITNSSGTMPVTFYLNANEDTMTEVDSENDTTNNEQEIVVGHRIPSSISDADIAGSWNVVQFKTPAQMSGDINNGLQGGNGFGVTNGSLTISANGTFSGKVGGAISGTYTIGSNGAITFNPASSGTPPFTCYLNFTKDAMTEVDSLVDADDNQQDLVVACRIPASVSLSDLAGSWNLIQFETPAQITIDGNNDLQGGDDFAVTTGTLIVNANGTVSGTLGEAFTGKLTIGSNGAIHASISSGGGSMPFTFYINAGKDTMTEVESQNDADNNEQQIVIAHRIPAN